MATRFAAAPMHLVAVADAAPATLVIADWRSVRRYPLASFAPGRAGGHIVHAAAAPWRRHRFWWSPEERYGVRLVRLSVEAPELAPAERASVRLRYLGRQAPPTGGFAYESAPVALPAEVEAGSRAAGQPPGRKTRDRTWNPAPGLPVTPPCWDSIGS